MATPRITIDQLPETVTPADAQLFVVHEAGTTKKMTYATLKAQTSTPLANHIADADDAHDATAISATDSANGITGATVQAQLGQLSTLAAGKLNQTTADGLYVNIAGDTMTGPLALPGDPANPLEAATKAYVDQAVIDAGGGITQPDADARYVNIDGDSMTGALSVSALISTNTGVQLPPGEPSAADRAATKAYVDSKLLAMWPVGSIYIGTTPTNPGTFIGGTWASFGAGRTLIGLDTSNTAFDTVEETGGQQNVTLAGGNLPAHTHAIDHNHASATSGAASATAHTHAIDHNHATATSSSAGAHQHGGQFTAYAVSAGGVWLARRQQDTATTTTLTESAGAHTHTVDLPAFTGASGSGGAAHTHSIDLPAFTGASGSAGSGTPFSNLPPYIVTYMWKRTA